MTTKQSFINSTIFIVILFVFSSCVAKKKYIELTDLKAALEQLLAQAQKQISELEAEKEDINNSYYNGFPVLKYPFKQMNNLHPIVMNSVKGKELGAAINKIGHELCNDVYSNQRYFVLKSDGKNVSGFAIVTEPEIIDKNGNHLRFVSSYSWLFQQSKEALNRLLNKNERIRNYIFILETQPNLSSNTGDVEGVFDQGSDDYSLEEALLISPIENLTCYVYCEGNVPVNDCLARKFTKKINSALALYFKKN